ncbi:sigma-54-dependent Fis family transcriptional regulator [Aneurinibacillus terranovensis]|uniref:sigma-54-dependent Fis family transcriptional regulator n=1 Tax=Aneurinibacillus terranovensis TaxID=278991 RepID=UPI0003F58260|nr:sigma 54-interacting transcriptional regulator [Aneurinibacillus terranovensis]
MHTIKLDYFDIHTSKECIRRIDKAKEDFIVGKNITTRIDQTVIDSWKRCQSRGFNHNKFKAPITISKEFLDNKINEEYWIRTAIGIIRDFNNIQNHIIILTDDIGNVLWMDGDKQAIKKAYDMNLLPGGNWSEEYTGTNAIGTAIYTKKPVQIVSTEHFWNNLSCWVCSSAPIFDPSTNQLLGIVDITGFTEHSTPHLLKTAIAIEKAIEIKLSYKTMIHQNKLIEEYGSAFDKWGQSNGILVVNKNGNILRLNPTAQQSLDQYQEYLMLDSLGRIQNDFIKMGKEKGNFRLTNHIELNVLPVEYDKQVIGSILVFSDLNKKVHPSVGLHPFKYSFRHIMTNSAEFRKTVSNAIRLARHPINILIEGESGTGKELFAHSIHSESNRSHHPFISINCGAIPKDLIASELFGYEPGAFTGASKNGQIGKFEAANNGTLFLDEIGEMPLDLQVYLLRVIQEKEIYRVGGKNPIPINVRIISATNKDLKSLVKKGEFREDLYYRLSSATINLLPLRKRKEDIPMLTVYFLQEIFSQKQRKTPFFSQRVKDILLEYHWPGNIRQLKHATEYMSIFCEDDEITEEHLPEFLYDLTLESTDNSICQGDNIDPQHSNEKAEIERIIEKHRGNLSAVSKELNITRPTLYKKLKQLNLAVIKKY